MHSWHGWTRRTLMKTDSRSCAFPT